jgi:hypothetical protein
MHAIKELRGIRQPKITTVVIRQALASPSHPAPRLSPRQHLREDHWSIAPECFDDVEKLQDVEAPLSLLVG